MDKSKIMTEAWAIVRRGSPKQTLRERLSRALKLVWWQVKQQLAVQQSVRAHFKALAAIPQENLIWELQSKEGRGDFDDRWRDLRGELLRRGLA